MQRSKLVVIATDVTAQDMLSKMKVPDYPLTGDPWDRSWC